LLVYFKAMNSLLDLSRLVQVVAPPILVLVCDRFFTAPLRALSPTGLSAATESSSYVGVVIDHWNDGNLPAGLVLNGDAARVVHAGGRCNLAGGGPGFGQGIFIVTAVQSRWILQCRPVRPPTQHASA
jgi:hypothetical protein